MDSTVERIADYALALKFTDLPAAVVHECKRRVIDTMGCGLGAFDAEPSRIARAMAARVTPASDAARVLGTAGRTLPELAAFANGVMCRYLDGNDTYPGGGGHPSDVIAAVMSAADAAGKDGATLITGIVLAYEVYSNLFRAACMRDRGMDHVFYTAVGGAVGAAKVLGLDRNRMAEAISLAVTPNLALEATRRGALSMWKGCAAGNAVRNGVFAAYLAAQGMTGPDKPFEGGHGLRELVGEFELGPFGGGARPWAITQANLKSFLSEYHSQAPITAALELHPQVVADDIESVTIDTYWFTWSEIGSEPEKWHPTTRETADHSLPWIVAAVLIDGKFSDAIFSAERLRDARVHAMSDKVSIREDKAFSQRFPQAIPCRIEVKLRGGATRVATVEYPRGHVGNPMTDDEVCAKFRDIGGRHLPAPRIESALQALWALDRAPQAGAVFDALRV
jgi:2-methylcitrate dehydratase